MLGLRYLILPTLALGMRLIVILIEFWNLLITGSILLPLLIIARILLILLLALIVAILIWAVVGFVEKILLRVVVHYRNFNLFEIIIF